MEKCRLDATPIIHLCLVNLESEAATRALDAWRPTDDETAQRRPGSVLARALLRGMLADLSDAPAERWRIASAASGAPIAVDQRGGEVPAISLSHSGPWVACAASFVGELGIDIELHKDTRDFVGIADRAFGTGERAATKRCGLARFYAIWTLREAVSKATGAGLRMAADAVDRVPDGPFEDSCWSRFDGTDWWLMHSRPSDELSLAVALHPKKNDVARSPIHVRWWPTAPASPPCL